MSERSEKPGSVRARKRHETRERIARVALELFERDGYHVTTLESVAAASGISARSLYDHFASKDELLHFWNGQGGFAKALGPSIACGDSGDPIAAVKQALLSLIPAFETPQSVRVSRILATTDGLRAAKQAFFVALEDAIYEALRQRWPERGQIALRAAAMLGAGALRIAGERQLDDKAYRPLAQYVEEVFAVLDHQADRFPGAA